MTPTAHIPVNALYVSHALMGADVEVMYNMTLRGVHITLHRLQQSHVLVMLFRTCRERILNPPWPLTFRGQRSRLFLLVCFVSKSFLRCCQSEWTVVLEWSHVVSVKSWEPLKGHFSHSIYMQLCPYSINCSGLMRGLRVYRWPETSWGCNQCLWS